MDFKVVAIVVTFHPDPSALTELLAAVTPQVSSVIVVDNTPVNLDTLDVSRLISPTLHEYICLGENFGLARALNIGIERALQHSATHVLLSDQDSLPSRDMVSKLLNALHKVSIRGKIGAVGPTYTDLNTGITFPFQSLIPGRIFYGHVHPTSASPIVEALSLISSGVLIPCSTLTEIGYMREDFFIDHIDIEWCLRARAAGYRIWGVGDARMHHRMGDNFLRVWYGRWRRESAYSPLRVYYRVRNFIKLCTLVHAPKRMMIRNAWYILGVIYTQCVFGRERIFSLKMAVWGFWDGVRGRMGPCERTPYRHID